MAQRKDGKEALVGQNAHDIVEMSYWIIKFIEDFEKEFAASGLASNRKDDIVNRKDNIVPQTRSGAPNLLLSKNSKLFLKMSRYFLKFVSTFNKFYKRSNEQ